MIGTEIEGFEMKCTRGCRGRCGWWNVRHSHWLITSESDVELAVVRKTECLPDGLCELLVPVRARPDLKAVRSAIKVDIHDSWGIGAALRR